MDSIDGFRTNQSKQSTKKEPQDTEKQQRFLRELNQIISEKLHSPHTRSHQEPTIHVGPSQELSLNNDTNVQNTLLISDNPLTVSLEDQTQARAEQDRDENGLRIDGFQEAGSHRLM